VLLKPALQAKTETRLSRSEKYSLPFRTLSRVTGIRFFYDAGICRQKPPAKPGNELKRQENAIFEANI
jgi:hypothetical protein